jgi:hypothetical protein
MELNDTQKQAVIGWAQEGLGLSEIQKNLLAEFDLKLTYMDVRFLVLDLDCNIQDKVVAPPKVDDAPPKAPTTHDLDGAASELSEEPGGGANVTVELDRVVKAGSVVSGTVIFSDGVPAAWAVDNSGRMVLDPGDKKDYRPAEEDVKAFQVELKRLITERGGF